jgi:hypothetical protein
MLLIRAIRLGGAVYPERVEDEVRDVWVQIKALETEHSWIAGEREYFGAAGGLYDFAARHASLAAQRVQQLAERRDKLARGLNARAHTLLGKEEDQVPLLNSTPD